MKDIFESLQIEHLSDGIVVATLDRPDKLNALTFEAFDEITRLCEELERDVSVRVLVLTGAGRAFCAGLDLAAAERITTMTPAEFIRGQEAWTGAAIAMQRLTIPVIAAVNGAAAGAGMSLALASDMRVASTKAKFNAAFVRIGLSGGDMGSSYLLPRLVGLGIANELLMTGRFVFGDEALRIGLVNQLVEPERLMPAALELARAVCANSPFGVRLTKQAVRTNLGAASLEQAAELENRNQALAAFSADMREALSAFLEKRQASFGPRD